MMRRRTLFAAVFAALAAPAWAGISEMEMARIDRLIQFVETRHDLKFVRNGSDHSCADAAKFLRRKFERMGEHVNTAQEFIDQIASKSSTSGQLYLIRFADGHTEPSGRLLGEELRRMDAAK
jgi:hypothetical protein